MLQGCAKLAEESGTILKMAANFAEFEGTLRAGEYLFACVPIADFFASNHNLVLTSPHIGLSNQRYVVYTKRGMVKKRYEEAVSWTLNDFTARLNSNEGAALGPFLYFLTMFTDAEETVAAGFRSASERDDFKELVNQAFENASQ